MGGTGISRRKFMGAAAVAGVAAVGAGLAGCSSQGAAASGASSASGSSSAASAATAKAAKPVVLVVSFGTSYNDSRHITIGAIENAIAEALWPDYEVRRAFTAQIIIDKLAKRDGVQVDNIEEALQRCIDDGVTELVVQPTHLMDGFEYQDVVAAVEEVSDQFEKVSIGEPLLSSDEDFDAVIAALEAMSAPYDDGETAFVFMGHGTEADSNKVYAELQDKLAGEGQTPYIITTVEAEPTFEDALAHMNVLGLKKAVLRPLMVVAGDHANNDMADPEDPESLVSVLTAAGIECTCVIEGLGQVEDIQAIYVDHTKAAVAAL